MIPFPPSAVTLLRMAHAEEEPVQVAMYPILYRGGHGAMEAEISAVLREINDLASTKPDWDGEGALPVTKQTRRNAVEGIKGVLLEAPAPEVSPNPNGTLSFEWEAEGGTAHLEVGQSMFSFYVSPRAGVPVLFDGPVDMIGRLHGSLVAELLFASEGPVPPATSIETLPNV